MSGAFLGVQPVVVPDYGETLARAQQYGINHLAALAQIRQMQHQEGQENALATLLPALTEADPARRLAALAGIGRYLPNVALPLLQKEHEQAEWRAIAQPAPATPAGGAPAAAEAAPASAPGGAASLPRGLRNNNPLNIEAGAFTQGQTGFQGSDGRFARFASLEDGLAAADRLLQSYAARGLTTPLAIVSRWAPAGDGSNNPQAYAAAVARQIGVAPDAPLDMSDPEVRRRVALAMAQVENGRPLPSGAGASPAASVPDLPAVPGFNLDLVRRAMANQYNPLAKAYLDSYYNAVRLLVRPETAPRSQERFRQDLELAERQAARVTVNNSGDRRTDTLVADQWDDLEKAVAQSGRMNVLLDRAAKALEQFQPGVFAERRLWLGKVAREFGLRSNVSEGEALRVVQRQIELATTPRGQGPITENERVLIRDNVNLLLATPEGARETMKLLRALNDYDAQIASIYRANARRNGGRPDPVSVREEVAAFVQRNPPPDSMATLSPYLAPEEVRRTGHVEAVPPPQVPASIPPPPGGGRIIMPRSAP